MFVKRLYRFVLKRLVGPFLLNNDLAIKDLDVKLRERTVELRNLALDVDVINASLGLAELRVVSANIGSLVLSAKDGFSVKVSDIDILVEPRGMQSASTPKASSKPSASAGDGVDDNIGSILSDGGEQTSLSEGLNSVEGWIERSMNMLKVQITNVNIELRIPIAHAVDLPWSLFIAVDKCESQTNFDAAIRQTELFGVHISLRHRSTKELIPISFIEPSEAADNKVCLIRAALDETFKDRGFEISVFALNIDLNPRSVFLLMDFSTRFAHCNTLFLSGDSRSSTPRVSIQTDSRILTMDKKQEMCEGRDPEETDDDEFFDAQSSLALSMVAKSTGSLHLPLSLDLSNHQLSIIEAEKKKQNLKAGSTSFRLEAGRVSLRAAFGKDSCLELRGSGVVVTNTNVAVNSVACALVSSSDLLDLSIDYTSDVAKHALSYTFDDQKLNLNGVISVYSSSKFSTLTQIVSDYGSALDTEGRDSDRYITSEIISLASSTSSTGKLRLESLPQLNFILNNELDELFLSFKNISGDKSGFSATNGLVSIRPVSLRSNTGDVFIYMEKSVSVRIVEPSSWTSNDIDEPFKVMKVTQNEISSRDRDLVDSEEDELELEEAINAFETESAKAASAVLDVSIGLLRTVDQLDFEVYQRVLSVLSSVSPATPDLRENPSPTPLIRLSCPTIALSLASLKSLPPTFVKFADFGIVAHGNSITVAIRHLYVTEGSSVSPIQCPLLFTSKFASDSQASVRALLVKKSQSDVKARIGLRDLTFRYEPRSLGMMALSLFLTPDGRGQVVDMGFRSDVSMEIENLVVDYFPSLSQFSSHDELSKVTTARLLATIGKVDVALCDTVSTLKRYDIELSDLQLFLARSSARHPQEHVHAAGGSKCLGLFIQEYAELNGFVCIGDLPRGSIFVRAEGIEWDTVEIEAVLPRFELKTCVDSFEALQGLLSRLADESAPTVKVPATGGGDGPGSPILILPRSSSNMPPFDAVSPLGGPSRGDHFAVSDSELPASALRERAVLAPDSSLNARQLQARYKKEPYLLPHVIDDYYSIGSLPSAILPRSGVVKSKRFEDADGTSKILLGSIPLSRSSSTDLVAEFDFVSISPSPPPVPAWSISAKNHGSVVPPRQNQNIVKSSSAANVSRSRIATRPGQLDDTEQAAPKALPKGGQKRRYFDEDDSDSSDEMNPLSRFDDDNDVDTDNESRDMMKSVLFTVPPTASPNHDASKSFWVAPPAVQLIEMDEITSKAKEGSPRAQILQQSVLGLLDVTTENGNDSETMVEDEANLYKTALLASSMAAENHRSVTFGRVASTNASLKEMVGEEDKSDAGQSTRIPRNSKNAGRGLWHSGQMLLGGESESLDWNERGEEEEDELDGVARYFDGQSIEQLHVRMHHFPAPLQPQPGSFLVPQATIAARLEAGGDSKDFAVKGKTRIILRDCNISWSLFGGLDFGERSDLMDAEPIYELPARDMPPEWKKDSSSAKVHFVVEDHFRATLDRPLFVGSDSNHIGQRSSDSKSLSRMSKREAHRVVQVVAQRVSLVMDAFGDGAMSLTFAVHDLDIVDQVASSPVKKLFQHWDNDRLHQRFTAEDMMRCAIDISAKKTINIHMAFLPVRLVINQDTLELISSFSGSNDQISQTSTGTSTVPSTRPLYVEKADFRAIKLKIDYFPKRLDVARLKQGKYSELVHLFSYEGMEVALKRARFSDIPALDQLGVALSEFWAQDVLNKQVYQLLAGISPTIKNLAVDMADIVLLPVDMFKGKSTASAAGSRAQKFAKTIVVEGCGLGKKAASAALNVLDEKRGKRLPKSMGDGVSVAAQALASRAKHMHHTIVAIPLTMWQKEGATGALKSVVRAIPIAVLQPVIGLGEALEALSSGVQFHVDPEEYKEEARRWKNASM